MFSWNEVRRRVLKQWPLGRHGSMLAKTMVVVLMSHAGATPNAVAGDLPSKSECSYTLHIFHAGVWEGSGPTDSVYETLDLIKALVTLEQAIPLGEANLGPAPAQTEKGHAYGIELVFLRDCDEVRALGHRVAEYLGEHHHFPIKIEESPGPFPPDSKYYRLDCDSRYWSCPK